MKFEFRNDLTTLWTDEGFAIEFFINHDNTIVGECLEINVDGIEAIDKCLWGGFYFPIGGEFFNLMQLSGDAEDWFHEYLLDCAEEDKGEQRHIDSLKPGV